MRDRNSETEKKALQSEGKPKVEDIIELTRKKCAGLFIIRDDWGGKEYDPSFGMSDDDLSRCLSLSPYKYFSWSHSFLLPKPLGQLVRNPNDFSNQFDKEGAYIFRYPINEHSFTNFSQETKSKFSKPTCIYTLISGIEMLLIGNEQDNQLIVNLIKNHPESIGVFYGSLTKSDGVKRLVNEATQRSVNFLDLV